MMQVSPFFIATTVVLVHLEEDIEENAAGVSSDPLACVRRAVLGHAVRR